MSEPINKSSQGTKRWEAHYAIYRGNGSLKYQTDIGPTSYLYNSSSLSGVTNPNWRSQVRRKTNASTPFSATKQSHNTKPYYLDYEQWSPTYDFGTADTRWVYWGYPYPYQRSSSNFATSDKDSALTKANNRAVSNFVNKARDYQSLAQGGMLLGEIRDTIAQIKRPLNGIRTGVDRYRRHVKKRATYRSGKPKFDNLRNLSQMVSDTWLEYSLGWKPFAADVKGAVDRICDWSGEDLNDSKEISGYGEETVSSVQKRSHSTTYLGPFLMDEVATYTVKVKCAGRVGTRANAIGYTAQRIGLDPSEYVPVVWELIPYSFIVDYFVNVGDIISAYSFNRSSIWWSYKVTKEIIQSDYTNWYNTYRVPEFRLYYSGGKWHQIFRRINARQPGAISSEWKSVVRDAEVGSLIPTLEFSIPGASTQWLNLATLFNASRYTRKLLRG